MHKRTFLPAIRTNGSNGKLPANSLPPMAARLQSALAEILTDAELKAILKQVLEEAKTGSPSEKRNARSLLLNLVGAKSAAPAPQYIQKNYYPVCKGKNGKGDKRAQDTLALVVRYLGIEGPAGPEVIAAAIARTASEVRTVLAANGDRFERLPRNGAAWSLKNGSVA